MISPIISASILASDFSNLQDEIEMLNKSQTDWIHLDIMDGHFVPNISFGLPVCRAIHQYAKKPLDVHLMIKSPEKYIPEFAHHGANSITVHLEACTHLHRTIHQIKDLGCKVGVALNPHSSIQLIKYIIKDIDLLLIMSVNPGFGGQKFINATYEKVVEAKTLIEESGSDATIEIDGGVTTDNARQLVNKGASALVVGSFLFNSPNPSQTIVALKKCR